MRSNFYVFLLQDYQKIVSWTTEAVVNAINASEIQIICTMKCTSISILWTSSPWQSGNIPAMGFPNQVALAKHQTMLQ